MPLSESLRRAILIGVGASLATLSALYAECRCLPDGTDLYGAALVGLTAGVGAILGTATVVAARARRRS